MRKPIGRLTDIFSLPDSPDGMPRTILMLDQLTHVPVAGDVLQIADRSLTIAQVDGRRVRDCLTGRKLDGQGAIAVLVHEAEAPLRAFVQYPERMLVSWTSHSDVPWHFKSGDLPTFTRLSTNWNAHPNDPNLRIETDGSMLVTHMRPNPYVYRAYTDIPAISLRFTDCASYRVTAVNDEGWYAGQCRFSGLAPSWGEFYEVTGDAKDEMDPTPWMPMTGSGARHFHFYFKDETLEVKAQDWTMAPVR